MNMGEYIEHFKDPFSTIKGLLWNGKVPRMLKVLHGTIDADLYSESTENIREVRCVLLQISVHHSLDFPESSAKLVYLSQKY